jgi:hypothetical protein
MPYFVDATDDVLTFDGIRSFVGGQASGLQSDLLAENQVQQLSNMTLSPKGNLETRVGTTNFCTTATSAVGSVGGMRYYETSAYEQLLTVTNGRFFSIESNGTATMHPIDATWSQSTNTWDSYTTQQWANGYSVNSATEVSMAQFNDKMYLADADGDFHFWNGSIITRQGGKVRAVTITTAGSGYTSATAIASGPNLGGTVPTFITTVAGGAVTGVTVVDGGSASA